MKKNYFSSHKLPKQQSTSFWSQGILGVKDRENPTWRWILDAVGCCFALLKRVCWPVLEECYVWSCSKLRREEERKKSIMKYLYKLIHA
jgi:hypothetical protein